MNTETEKLKELNKLIPDRHSRHLFLDLLHALPNIVAVLNEDRKLVFSNQVMLDTFSIPNFEQAFHLRPGELFKCVNSDIEPEGCGASEACQLCGALRAMEDSKTTRDRVTNDCRILSRQQEKSYAYNFRFTSTPFFNEDSMFFVVTIEDISHETRKHELERIFFHDIINSLSGLHGVLMLLKTDEKIRDIHLNILEESYKTLYQTILEQKEFSEAETGELSLKLSGINTIKLLNDILLPFQENTLYESDLTIEPTAVNADFVSDPILLSRILTNMVKNALEASGNGDTIKAGATMDEASVTFSVNNPGFIKRNTQLQIFERSFSTKGTGRGLGTYSMKLLGENYLGGRVWFSSNKEEGTTFFISLDLNGKMDL